MANQRLARTEKLIKVEITKILKTKVKNPIFYEITITDVKLTNDLSYATITWYLYTDDKAKITKITNELENVKSFCRKQLALVFNRYKIPELRFKYDKTEEQANKIEMILKKIATEKSD